MKSNIVKRSIVVTGHKTSVSLEDAFWKALKDIARDRDLGLSEMVSVINSARVHSNLSSAIRLFVLDHYRALVGATGNERASHQESIGYHSAQVGALGADAG